MYRCHHKDMSSSSIISKVNSVSSTTSKSYLAKVGSIQYIYNDPSTYLGKGSNGKIFRGYLMTKNSLPVAVKRIDIINLVVDDEDLHRVARLDHANIVRLLHTERIENFACVFNKLVLYINIYKYTYNKLFFKFYILLSICLDILPSNYARRLCRIFVKETTLDRCLIT